MLSSLYRVLLQKRNSESLNMVCLSRLSSIIKSGYSFDSSSCDAYRVSQINQIATDKGLAIVGEGSIKVVQVVN